MQFQPRCLLAACGPEPSDLNVSPDRANRATGDTIPRTPTSTRFRAWSARNDAQPVQSHRIGRAGRPVHLPRASELPSSPGDRRSSDDSRDVSAERVKYLSMLAARRRGLLACARATRLVRANHARVIPWSSGSLESVVTMTTTTTKRVATTQIAPQLAEAHKHASQHRVEIEASTRCGCFFCFRTFPPLSIKAWIDARQTALCPGCGVDSVLGNASPHRIDDAFLPRMHGQFFARRSK